MNTHSSIISHLLHGGLITARVRCLDDQWLDTCHNMDRESWKHFKWESMYTTSRKIVVLVPNYSQQSSDPPSMGCYRDNYRTTTKQSLSSL